MRAIVLDPVNVGLDDRAEALLFAASRADHAARVIRPALKRGDVVICDRYLDSSVAYQGVGRDLGETEVRDLSLWATRGPQPDLTIVLDIDPGDTALRMQAITHARSSVQAGVTPIAALESLMVELKDARIRAA